MTFNTIIRVRVPEYDVYIPELKTHGPVMNFMPTKVRNVVNMMERGLTIKFFSPEDERKVFDLVKQYTLIANSENERLGKTIYKIPVQTQTTIARNLNLKKDDKKKEDNPWVNKHYTVRVIENDKKSKVQQHVRVKKQEGPRIPKLYEMFKEQMDPDIIPSQGYDDLNLD